MILVFGGTTEGRMAVSVLEEAGKPFYYSTKGDSQKVELHNGVRLTGAKTLEDVRSFIREKDIRLIVDAAHPFAVNLHHTIESAGLPVIRLSRRFPDHEDGIIYCKDFHDAVMKIRLENPARLLALSGVNTISSLRGFWKDHDTFFRILNRPESLDIVRREGFPEDHIVYYSEECLKSPGDLPGEEMELELMRSVACDAILMKESGESGGEEAKIRAAKQLGVKIFVVEHPALPESWTYVTGKFGLRRAIEKTVPEFFPLKTGLTTGACATAASKAAIMSLILGDAPEVVSFCLPDGEVMSVSASVTERGVASVVKDFSDDPDVTKGCRITSRISLSNEKGSGIRFLQGEGVGIVTLPGLGIPVGGPAINPTPRAMIQEAIREVTDMDVDVTIMVENGRELARRTFNPKVGVVDGISIIGTSGIVHPLSNEAFVESIGRELEVARAIGRTEIGLASGKKGEEALLEKEPSLRVIHYGNFVGETLRKAQLLGFDRVVLGIMIGKAVKLSEGNLDTHSHKVQMNKEYLKEVARSLGLEDRLIEIEGITMARELWNFMPEVFFEEIRRRCLMHCRKVFPDKQLEIRLICEIPS